MSAKPTEKELASRIRKAIEANPSELTFALWEGYIGALLEWGLIEPSCHSRLCELILNQLNYSELALACF